MFIHQISNLIVKSQQKMLSSAKPVSSEQSFLPDISVLSDVPEDFSVKAKFFMRQLPPNFVKPILNGNCKIYLYNNFDDFKNLFKNYKFDYKDASADGLFFNDGARTAIGINYNYSNTYPPFLNKTVNHEFSHAFDNALGFNSNPYIRNAYHNDIHALQNRDVFSNFSRLERDMLNTYFLGEGVNVPLKEAIADLLATNLKGGGVYSAKISDDYVKEDIMLRAFPRLNEALHRI